MQVKLFWKEVREDLIPMTVGKTIWDELPAANVDTQKLEHLFESRAKDLMSKVTFCFFGLKIIRFSWFFFSFVIIAYFNGLCDTSNIAKILD